MNDGARITDLIPLSKSIYAKRTISHSGRDERLLVLGTQTRAPTENITIHQDHFCAPQTTS
jgi:hypothetical protein